jgi:hypothetical protein
MVGGAKFSTSRLRDHEEPFLRTFQTGTSSKVPPSRIASVLVSGEAG